MIELRQPRVVLCGSNLTSVRLTARAYGTLNKKRTLVVRPARAQTFLRCITWPCTRLPSPSNSIVYRPGTRLSLKRA
jgi:hypothetical protein